MAARKNVSLIVGIGIPVLMIVLVAGGIYLPMLFAPAPKFHFLYVTGDDYYQGKQYVVEGGRLAKREVNYPEHYTPGVARLFVHNMAGNESQEIVFEEAQTLSLDPRVKSPDGYTVVHGSAEYGVFPIFFGSDRDYNAVYIKGHATSKKLHVEFPSDTRYAYEGRFRFLGWLKQ
jgi:hypothetical protein